VVEFSFFGISKLILLFNFPEVAWVCSVAAVKYLKLNQIGFMVSRWAKQLAIGFQCFAFLLSGTSFSILLLPYLRFSSKTSSLCALDKPSSSYFVEKLIDF